VPESHREPSLYQKPKKRRLGARLPWIAALAAAVLLALNLLRVGATPELTLEPELPGIGPRTAVKVTAQAPGRGLGRIEVYAEQGSRRELLVERDYRPRPFWAFWGPRITAEEIDLEVGHEVLEGLEEGQLTLRVTAARAPTWLRRPAPAELTRELPVRLRPPTLEILSRPVRIEQGGASVVIYRRGEGTVRDGVENGEWFFPGFALPGGGEGERFAFFAAPYDQPTSEGMRLVAADALGNVAARGFIDHYKRKPQRHDTIALSQKFMERVVPVIQDQTPSLDRKGDLLQQYLRINRELRRDNAAELRRLATSSRAEQLWTRTFMQMPSARAMASFADRRTYTFQGEDVDQQDHLGYDLASVRRAPVPAANDGVVALARYFGIYGNTVVIDHGFGLMSLYSHLSEIAVEEGQLMVRGETLGRTGQTGLAGGDHLHFSMLLHGLQVNPLEWWDGHWIRDRIATPLSPALNFETPDRNR